MAAGDVNVQAVTISSGAITLTGSPTGSGYYTVGTEGGAASDDLTAIGGGSGYAVITLRPATAGQYFTLRHDGVTIFLDEGLDFEPLAVTDSITLRLDGSVWVEQYRKGGA